MSRPLVLTGKEKVVESLYSSGLTQREVGTALGVSEETVNRFMKFCGIPVRRLDENPTLRSCHKRVYRKRGMPQRCEVCGTEDPKERYEWANLTGDYQNIEDYKRMCHKCHVAYDLSAKHKRISKNVLHGTVHEFQGTYDQECCICGFKWKSAYPRIQKTCSHQCKRVLARRRLDETYKKIAPMLTGENQEGRKYKYTEISKITGIDKFRVYKVAKAAGITRYRKRGNRPPQAIQQQPLAEATA